MNLGEVREKVREQLDVDAHELPDEHLDWFVEDGFEATIGIERRWPFYEKVLNETVVSSPFAFTDPVTEVIAVRDDGSGRYLSYIEHTTGLREFADVSGGVPLSWSMWGGQMFFWPDLDGARDFTMLAYRRPVDWMADDVTEMDCDRRLQDAVVLYAMARAYQKQEDPYLADMYWASWEQKANQSHAEIMRTSQFSPKVLNGGTPRLPGSRWSF